MPSFFGGRRPGTARPIYHALDRNTRQITEGPIVQSLFVIAGPIVLTNILHSAYQLTDTFRVGRLGAEGVAAVSVCYPIIFFLMGAGLGLSIAGSVFVAQYAGARRHDMLNHVSSQTILMIAGGLHDHVGPRVLHGVRDQRRKGLGRCVVIRGESKSVIPEAASEPLAPAQAGGLSGIHELARGRE